MAAKRYRAVVAFSSPDGEAELKKCAAGKPYREIKAQVGDVLDEPCAGLLKSWLANGAVEEVKGSGSGS